MPDDVPPDRRPDTYDALAPIYDALGGESFALRVLERLRPLLAAIEVEASAPSFLDLGCGTGTLLLSVGVERPHWRLVGLDASAGMLAAAVQKPGHQAVLWTRARLPGPLPFRDRFDLIGAFYDTLNHLPDEVALAASFGAVAALLRPGGRLVFDLNNAFGFERWWQHRVALDVGDRRLETRLHYDARARTGRAEMTLSGPGGPQRLLLTERCFSEAEVRDALAQAGLTLEIAAPWRYLQDGTPSKTWFEAAFRR
ncbi:MAG TPA: class I SAM-dependent methyltransferase [Polyangia bacterium]|nr:class I SAM-dependent methyltransferase [Polyangia bacterium]